MPDFTGSFSGSFEGNGSGLKSVNYYNLSNLPTTITPFQKNSILANNSIRDNFVSNVKTRLNAEGVISSSAQLTTEFDARYGNETGDGLISSSAQITDVITDDYISASAASSGFGQGGGDVSALNAFTSSITTRVNSLTSATSSYLTSLPTGTISGSTQVVSSLPNGTISSSAQITALGYSTTDNDSQTLSLVGQTLSISSGNSVSLAGLGSGGSGGSSIWNTGSQDPESYTKLMTQNNLEVTGSVDIKGDFTVNGQSIFTQTSASNAGNAIVVNGRLKVLEQQIGDYIASASIQIGNTQDTIDCGGFF